MDTVSGVGVLDKAVDVIRAIADEPRSLGSLQTATGLPRATAHRIAVALETHGLLRRDREGSFDLGPELASLGRTASARFPLAEHALATIEALRDGTGESAQLFVCEGLSRRCLLSLQTPHALRWIVPEGALFPLELGSAGHALQGDYGAEGWVESVEEREAGVASVSAPVFDRDRAVIAAVSISGPIERISREPGARFGRHVVEAARRIERDVGTER